MIQLTAYIKRPQPILCQKSVIIPPYSEVKIASYLRLGRQADNLAVGSGF
jgi:hypothetical protein